MWQILEIFVFYCFIHFFPTPRLTNGARTVAKKTGEKHQLHSFIIIYFRLYLKYGHHYLWDKRGWLIKKWHRLRGKPSNPPSWTDKTRQDLMGWSCFWSCRRNLLTLASIRKLKSSLRTVRHVPCSALRSRVDYWPKTNLYRRDV